MLHRAQQHSKGVRSLPIIRSRTSLWRKFFNWRYLFSHHRPFHLLSVQFADDPISSALERFFSTGLQTFKTFSVSLEVFPGDVVTAASSLWSTRTLDSFVEKSILSAHPGIFGLKNMTMSLRSSTMSDFFHGSDKLVQSQCAHLPLLWRF